MSARLTASGRCSECGKLQVRFDTDLITSRLLEIPSPCRCMLDAAKPKPKQKREWVKHVDQERRRACICQRCDLPTVGKPKIALYCEAHREEARAEVQKRHREKVGDKHWRAYQERNREKLRRKARQSYQRNKKERERRNAYKRAWRKLNRDKVRAQKERAALREWRKPDAYGYVRAYREEVEAGLRKPKRARRNRKGERLCLTEGCYSVMQGRARKCDRCKRREAKAAAEVLGRAA